VKITANFKKLYGEHFDFSGITSARRKTEPFPPVGAVVPLSPFKVPVTVTLESPRVSSASAKGHLLLQDKTLPVSMSSEVHMEDTGCQL